MSNKNKIDLKLGEKIRHFRIMKGFSQSEIERRTGLKREYLSKIENGDLKNPTISTIQKLANGLEIRISELLSSVESFEQKEQIIKIVNSNYENEQQDKIEESTSRYISVPVLDSNVIAKNIKYIDKNNVTDFALIQSDSLEPTDDHYRYRCMKINPGNEYMSPIIRSNSLVCIDGNQCDPYKLAGSIVALRNEEGDCLIAYLKIYSDRIVGIPENLTKYNPIVMPITKNSPVLGKVVWFSTSLDKPIQNRLK